jgi:hypothetical protein
MIGLQTYIKERFNLKDDDYTKIKLLFLYSFFLGLFIAFYFVPANSNFLSNFGHWELPYAYVISGIVGVIAIAFYTFIQSRKKTKTLFLSAIIFMFVVSIADWLIILYLRNSNYSPELKNKLISYLNFFVFIWAWPFIALVATITGGLAIRLFNLLQVKKFYGLINLGGVLAATISYFSISQILKLLNSEYDLILIGSIGLIGAVILLLYIYKKFPEKPHYNKKIPKKNKERISFFKILFSNKFILYIFLGASISAVLIYITDYGFLVTVKANRNLLLGGDIAIAKFLSLVYGGLKVGEFLISLFSGRILTKGGLKIGLTMLPFIITFFFLAAYLEASIYSYISVTFLGLMTLAKMLERIVRRGVDDPAFNVLYQTLPEEKKLFIQTRVGVIQQSAIAIAGALLIIVNLALKYNENQFKLNYYTLYALPILFLAIIIAWNLYKRYKLRIKEILAEKRLFKFEYIEKDIFANDTLKMFILKEDIDASKFSTIVLAETNPRSLETYAAFLLKVQDPIIRKAVLSNIDSTYNEKLIPIIERVGDSISFKNKELKKLFLNAFFKLDYSEIDDFSPEEITKMALSNNLKANITATKYLFRKQLPNDEKLILELLKSNDKTVKFAAIKIAGKRKKPQLWLKLIDMLSDKEFSNVVVNILVEIGDQVLKDINIFAQKVKNYDTIIKILQIYAKIGTPKAQRLLVGYLNFPNREIQHLAILSLQYSGYIAREDTFNVIKDKIKSVVANIVWFLVSIKDLVREKNTLKLIQALDLERLNSLEDLFTLLSFTQSTEIVELIKTNIYGENTIFALELIDNFIEPEIKKIILPLFEPISLGQKIRRFKQYFYFKPIGMTKRLIDIVMTDSTSIDIWSQAKAIELLNKILDKEKLDAIDLSDFKIKEPKNWSKIVLIGLKSRYVEMTPIDAIICSVLHPSNFIASIGLKILYDNNIKGLDNFVDKLNPKKQKIYSDLKANKDLISDKIKALRRAVLFFTIPEKNLISLAQIVVSKKLSDQNSLEFIYQNQEYIFIIVKGKLQYKDKNTNIVLKRNTVVIRGLNIPQKANSIQSAGNSQVFIVKRFDFFNLLASNNKIVLNLLSTMKF